MCLFVCVSVFQCVSLEQRRQLYKRMVRGQEGLWDEYNKLRREVKHLVMERKQCVNASSNAQHFLDGRKSCYNSY